MQFICLNPSCCNVDTFDGDTCPYCGDVMVVDTGTIVKALASDESTNALIEHLDLDTLEAGHVRHVNSIYNI